MSNSSDTRRFGGISRLYGQAAYERLTKSHVCIVGLGGVGSWCAEALARAGVARLTLIDGDTVAESNLNRQLPALEPNLGRFKAEVLAERFAQINPACHITTVTRFVEPECPGALIPTDALLIDAIDSMDAKAALIDWAHKEGLPLLVSGGAGGRVDPARVCHADISRVKGDPLLGKLRSLLRKEYGFPPGHNDPKKVKPFGIVAAYSDEPARGCAADAVDIAGIGAGFGTSMVVTATLGLRLALLAIDRLIQS